MKSTKREFGLYSFYDHTGICSHLEKMAAKGWMLEKVSNFGWVYRRAEPKTVHFSVVYFPTASDFDPSPGEDQQTFRDYCAEAGWQPVASWAQMLIFANESEAPVPMETEAAVQVENIHLAMKRNYLIGQAVLLALALLQIGMQVSNLLQDLTGALVSLSPLFGILVWLLLAVQCTVEVTSYFLWRRRAARAAELDGSFTPTRSHRSFQAAELIILALLFLLWLLSLGRRYTVVGIGSILAMVLLQCSVNGVKTLMKRSGRSTGVNRAVTLAACLVLAFAFTGGLTFCMIRLLRSQPGRETYTYMHVTYDKDPIDLPLTMQDLTGRSYEHISRDSSASQSVFLARRTCQERVQSGSVSIGLDYEITDIKTPWLRGLVMWDYLENTGFSVRFRGIKVTFDWDWRPEESPGGWGADAAYRKYTDDGQPTDKYLLFYGDRIVEIAPDGVLTDAQRAIVGEKLHPGA